MLSIPTKRSPDWGYSWTQSGWSSSGRRSYAEVFIAASQASANSRPPRSGTGCRSVAALTATWESAIRRIHELHLVRSKVLAQPRDLGLAERSRSKERDRRPMRVVDRQQRLPPDLGREF